MTQLFIDFSVATIFLSFGLICISIIFFRKVNIEEENYLAGIFILLLTANNFILGNKAFISAFNSSISFLTYSVLMYTGIKPLVRTLFYKYRGEVKSYQTSISFIFSAMIFSCISSAFLMLGIGLQNNFFIMFNHIIIVCYTAFTFIFMIKILTKEKLFFIKTSFSWTTFFTNYIVIGFFCSLYELGDFYFYIKDIKKYVEYGKYYDDPTHTFDIFWILICIVGFLILPRMIKLIRKRSFLIKNDINKNILNGK